MYVHMYIACGCYKVIISTLVKGPAHNKNGPHWTSMTHTGPIFFFCKSLLNYASHDTKIDCISLVWAGAKKYKF